MIFFRKGVKQVAAERPARFGKDCRGGRERTDHTHAKRAPFPVRGGAEKGAGTLRGVF